MNRLLFPILFFVLFPSLLGQTVDSIKVEQIGEFIKIRYHILNSNPNQRFRVSLSCSINGGLKSELHSLSGDFGDNIIGGRTEYSILWDVLKEVDELNTVDFFVKAELMKRSLVFKNADTLDWSKERSFLIFSGLAAKNNFQIGGRYGFLGKWGMSISFLSGWRTFSYDTDYSEYRGYTALFDISRRVINKDYTQLHFLAGTAIANQEALEYPEGGSVFLFGFDFGMVVGIKRIALFTSYSGVILPLKESDLTTNPGFFINLGIGIRY